MALNIDIVNSTVINVYETDGIPRSYFGATGASGRFYPSGTSGALLIDDLSFIVISDNTSGLVDGGYNSISSTSNGSGTPNATFDIDVTSGLVTNINAANYSSVSGYALGDFITIQGSDLGGSGEIVLKVTMLDMDGLLIVIGGDFYEVKWYNLVIDGVSPASLSDAADKLATLFSTL
jgi:hypothetical protein